MTTPAQPDKGPTGRARGDIIGAFSALAYLNSATGIIDGKTSQAIAKQLQTGFVVAGIFFAIVFGFAMVIDWLISRKRSRLIWNIVLFIVFVAGFAVIAASYKDAESLSPAKAWAIFGLLSSALGIAQVVWTLRMSEQTSLVAFASFCLVVGLSLLGSGLSFIPDIDFALKIFASLTLVAGGFFEVCTILRVRRSDPPSVKLYNVVYLLAKNMPVVFGYLALLIFLWANQSRSGLHMTGFYLVLAGNFLGILLGVMHLVWKKFAESCWNRDQQSAAAASRSSHRRQHRPSRAM